MTIQFLNGFDSLVSAYLKINSNFSSVDSELNQDKNLIDLADVEIASPTESQILQYDASDAKWKNQTPVDYDLTIKETKILSILGVI
jgi:hypothetical protein